MQVLGSSFIAQHPKVLLPLETGYDSLLLNRVKTQKPERYFCSDTRQGGVRHVLCPRI